MDYVKKSFTVPGPKKVQPTRDCITLGHWPRTDRKGRLVCYWCSAFCKSDGTPAETEEGQ